MTHINRDQTQALVHVVDADNQVRLLLVRWLDAAGIESRTYAHLEAFLSAHPVGRPGCVVIDAQPLSAPSPRAICCPIVVTAYQADVAMAVRAMKTGAIDFVEKPLRESEIVAAVCAAIEVDRRRSLATFQRAALLAPFATLTRRERQVMALVTSGMLNKQVGAHLDLSEITVKAHRGAAMRKMGARSLAALVRMADALGEELLPQPKSDSSVPVRSAFVADRHSGYSLGR